ncbi:hypothetical protein [Helicobacter marmotae]|uniref:hypothetical protein n=1 Tax=Helicobacter marmotae TaxID=152490 RepID=UPI0011C018F5|nr:hypothetical protein [Helicobacter marmotae]
MRASREPCQSISLSSRDSLKETPYCHSEPLLGGEESLLYTRVSLLESPKSATSDSFRESLADKRDSSVAPCAPSK